MNTVNVAVIGATGYTGQELLRILARHPAATATAVMTARAGTPPTPPALPVDTTVDALDLDRLDEVDGVFLCTPHGAATPLVQAALQKGTKVVDLSADFRLTDKDVYQQTYGQEHPTPELLAQAVYGLTEHYRAQIAGGVTRYFANLIARLPDDVTPIFTSEQSRHLNYPRHSNLQLDKRNPTKLLSLRGTSAPASRQAETEGNPPQHDVFVRPCETAVTDFHRK